MSINSYRWMTWCFGLLCVVLLATLALVLHTYSWRMSDIRYAHEVARGFQDRRDYAIKRGVTQAADELYSLQIPPGAAPFQNPLESFVERERQRAVADIISYLRAKTGKDLGNDVTPWIFEYGSDSTRQSQTNLVESK